jgi:hypothetical protein
MSRGRIVTRTILLLLGVGLAVSACATEPVAYGPDDYGPDYSGYYGYYGDGFVFGPGGGRFHGHHGFARGHGGFGGHGGFAGHGGGGAHGGGAGGGGGHGGGR